MVELIGGTGAARRLILRALERGKPSSPRTRRCSRCTARRSSTRRRRSGVDVAFEASVGGGIPILRSLREGLAANRIQSRARHHQRHHQLRAHARWRATGEPFEACAEARAGARLRRGRPELRRRRHRRRAQAHAARGDGVRRASSTFKEIPTEGIRAHHAARHRGRARVRLPHQAARDRQARATATSASRCACTRRMIPRASAAREGGRRDERDRGARRRGRARRSSTARARARCRPRARWSPT